MTYVPALDGLRALAVLAVMAFHADRTLLPGGFFGVDMFFVLSGYLITRLLVAEQGRTGRIALGSFYLRRALRLYPALLLMLAAYLLLAPGLFPDISRAEHLRDAAITGLYLSDYARAFLHMPDILQHGWSLAVEEHFYLIWPLLLPLLLGFGRGGLARGLLLLFCLAMAWRWFSVAAGQDWSLVYYRFDTRLSGLVMGAVLAVMPGNRALSARLCVGLAVTGLIILGWAFTGFAWREPAALLHGMLWVELATVCLILSVSGLNAGAAWPARLLSAAPLVFLGKLSYGLYLWHYPVMRYFRETEPGYVVLVAGSAIALACAVLSHVTVEAWARNLRQRLKDRDELGGRDGAGYEKA